MVLLALRVCGHRRKCVPDRGGARGVGSGCSTQAMMGPELEDPSGPLGQCAHPDPPGYRQGGLPASPTCFSTLPSRPIMLGSSGSSASAGPLVRSLSVMAGPRPTIWSTLPGRDPAPWRECQWEWQPTALSFWTRSQSSEPGSRPPPELAQGPDRWTSGTCSHLVLDPRACALSTPFQWAGTSARRHEKVSGPFTPQLCPPALPPPELPSFIMCH